MTSRHGLANVGNSCYLNSAFQALSRSSFFSTYFGTDTWVQHRHDDRKGAALATQTATLVSALRTPGDAIIIPGLFVRAFVEFAREINDDIRFGAQADAAEAIQILMDGLHMQLACEVNMRIKHTAAHMTPENAERSRSLESWKQFFQKEYSPLIGAYYGQTQTKVVCTGCKAASTRYEPWAVLKVPIPGADKEGADAPNLQACIAGAFASETIDDYACDACKAKGPAAMSNAISRFPAHVILSLKRFTNQGRKVRARIAYDEDNIDLSPWQAWSSGGQVYRVMSAVEHLGSSRGGHYIMRTRDLTDGKWYVYDDGAVSVSPIGGAAGPDTYILFLEQVIKKS